MSISTYPPGMAVSQQWPSQVAQGLGQYLVETRTKSERYVTIKASCSVGMAIVKLDGGFLLTLSREGEEPHLCIGADSIEQGVRLVMAHLVEQKLAP